MYDSEQTLHPPSLYKLFHPTHRLIPFDDMTNLPVVSREVPVSVVTPFIPLTFAHPSLTLAQILWILRAHWKASIVIALAVMSFTLLALAMWPRTYTATATLMVNYEVNDPTNGKDLPVGQVGTYIATQVELMQTPEALLAVVDRLNLTQNDNYARDYRGDGGTLREWVATKLGRALVIYQSQLGSQLIYVTYSASERVEAAQVANTVIEVYKDHDHMRSTGPPGDRAKLYAQQLQDLKTKVDQAQTEVTAFHQRNGLIDEGKNNVDLSLLATLEGRLLEAQNARRVAAARASADQSVSDQVLGSNQTQALKTQVAVQELRLAQLNRVYTARHPDVAESQFQLKAARTALASAIQNYSDNASAGLKAAQRLERDLQHAVMEQRAKVLAKGQVQGEAAKYLLELDSAQAVYKRALEGYDQIMFASSGHYTNVSLVSHATPPVKASKPKVLTGLVLGGLSAIILGLGIPLGYDLFNRRVRCRDDLERYHGIPVLAEFGIRPMRITA